MRWIVLPLYFRAQQIFPFYETFAFRRLSLDAHLAGYQERSLRRLNFWSSDSIRSGIRELYVLAYPPGYNRRHRVVPTPVEAVMELLLTVLPRFEQLTKLVLQFPPCNGTLFSALGSLRLDIFELELPSTAVGEIPIPTRREFLFNRNASPNQAFALNGLSLRLLFPESIQRVVAGPTGTDALTQTLLSHPSGLISLKTLDLSLRFVASTHFPKALEACPNLSSMRLRASAIDIAAIPSFLPPLPANTIPHLTCYHGPANFGPSFARSRTLRVVRLWSSHSVSAVSAPWLLHPILPQLGPGVTTLELGVTLVPDGLLETIRDAFPALTTLAFNAHLDSFHPGTVARRVLVPPVPHRARLALPAGMRLQSLRLGTQLAGGPDAALELFDSAHAAVRAFPGDYDPTSWRRWIVDRPWYCVEWACAIEGGVDPDEQFGTALDGTLSVEYGEHYFQGFQRGERISAQAVNQAVSKMSVMSAPPSAARRSLSDDIKQTSGSNDSILENSEVAVVEFTERWTYYGTTNLCYIRAPLPLGSVNGSVAPANRAFGVAGALGKGQEKAFAISTFNTFFVYVTPFLGAIIADTKWGRTRLYSYSLRLGHIILVSSATPAALQHPNTSLGLLVLAIFVMAVGAGPIKANVALLIADQYTGRMRKRYTPRHTISVTLMYDPETLPTGEVVIVTPGLTIQSIYLYFYMAINLGSTGAISASFLARDNKFWVAYLVPTCIFATMPIVLFSFRKFYVITLPRGSILLETFRVIGLCLAARWSPLTAWRNIRSKGFWDTAKSSSYKTGEIPAKITWDDE
ncbi:hypothetical protein K438DRAFT_1957331 [Mycena galopus ATCC 62051]|nr:hypothetical protein K438DRAFT_1957331 [Mycena galopus ATCC 62051]